MADSIDSQLQDETAAWCRQAEQIAQRVPDDGDPCLALVREGILLRRRWDRVDPDAPPRRRLLTLLADAQILCHRRLTDSWDHAASPDPQRLEQLTGRLADDHGYLAELLSDHTLSAETMAFALECFRDDLHWLGTLIALLDGHTGVDFIGRVLLEQESLQRTISSSAALPEQLLRSARQLRTTALARQAESLLGQPDPDPKDPKGWYRAWQTASRLAMRPRGATDEDVERAVHDYRARAMDRWSECLAEIPSDTGGDALRQAADDLADVAGEALTFMEDLPLPEAVRSLEILKEDAAACAHAAQQHGGSVASGLRRRLRRRTKAVAAELQERQLAWRMERLFGYRAVAALERLILLLLLLFVGMLSVEWAYRDYQTVLEVCAWLDLGICLVLLSEFSLKMALAEPRRLYLRRNWITGLLPAIPFGFIVYMADEQRIAEAAELFVLLRGLRYLRLSQMARWLRLARPIVRVARLVGFALQASDRLVRRIAPLLNRNLVLFERAAIHIRQPAYRTSLAALRQRFQYHASESIGRLPSPSRRGLVRARIDDLTAMLSAPRVGMTAAVVEAQVSTTREIPLESVIARLLAATPAGVSHSISRSLAQSVARWCRAFDVFGVRRLPLIRDLVAAGRRRSPYGTTAEVANRIGSLLKHQLDRVHWVADLYGALTAPQWVDALGDRLVKGTARPAWRLLIIGAAFLAVTSLAGLLPFPEQVRDLSHLLGGLIGTPLVVLGLLCLAPLCVGVWFRQIAGEAADFCTQVAEAQFLSATKQLKRRFARQHHAVLYSRVIAPELGISTGQTSTGQTSTSQPSDGDSRQEHQQSAPDPNRVAVELLFEDYLDGAPFHRSDTKTTTQLLGNLTLISLRETRLGLGRRRRRQLRRLDLANTRSWFRGPYLWFHCISRSLAQQTAKLVVDYNTYALPLNRAATADDRQVRRHLDWLARRLNRPIAEFTKSLPAEFRSRLGILADAAALAIDGRPAETKSTGRPRDFHGSDFTAIHFLSDDPQLEADVRRRYGDEVAELMHRDRRDNIRRVFRTYPFHRWPKRQRTFNPLAMHARYLAGGRVLLLPLRMVWWGAIATLHATRLVARFVRDVLYPTVGDLDAVADPDPLAVAVRKIHRMRQPVFLECLRMRADFDPEYLGAAVFPRAGPGSTALLRCATAAPIEEDLARIDADPGVLQHFRGLAGRRRRQMLELRRLLAKLDCRRHGEESLRAMALAYAIDYRGVRSGPKAVGRLKKTFDEAVAEPSPAAGTRKRFEWSLPAWWCRWRYAGRLARLLRQPAFSGYDASQRRLCRRLLCRRRGRLLQSLRRLTRRDAPADALDDSRDVLLAVARDPATWTRQLVILRAVQTLSVLDLKTYCDLVEALGEYETCTAEGGNGMATYA